MGKGYSGVVAGNANNSQHSNYGSGYGDYIDRYKTLSDLTLDDIDIDDPMVQLKFQRAQWKEMQAIYDSEHGKK